MNIPQYLITMLATVVFIAGFVLLIATKLVIGSDDLVFLAVVCILGSILTIAHLEV